MKFWILLIAAVSLSAQTKPSLETDKCAALRHHGDPDAKNCYQRLTKSTDPETRAEGYWGIGDFKQANETLMRI